MIATEGEVFQAICIVKFDTEVTSASVVWDKGGRNVVLEDQDKYTVSESRPPSLKSVLTIRNMQKEDGGQFTCRATQFANTISQFKQFDIHIRVQCKIY